MTGPSTFQLLLGAGAGFPTSEVRRRPNRIPDGSVLSARHGTTAGRGPWQMHPSVGQELIAVIGPRYGGGRHLAADQPQRGRVRVRANSTALRSRSLSPSSGATNTRHRSKRSLIWTSRTTQHRPLPSTVASLDSRARLHVGAGFHIIVGGTEPVGGGRSRGPGSRVSGVAALSIRPIPFDARRIGERSQRRGPRKAPGSRA